MCIRDSTKEDVTAANDAFPFIHGIYRAERSAVPITAKLSVKNNEPVSLTLCDGVNTVCVSGDIPDVYKRQRGYRAYFKGA